MIKKFVKDNRGAIFAWVIAFVMIFAYSAIWFTAGWAALEVVETAEAEFDLEDRALGNIDLAKTVFAFHPVIVIVGYLLYALVNSQRRDVRVDSY